MNSLLTLWQKPIVYRTAIGLYVALVLALAGIIFSVNSLDVQSAAYIRADTQWEPDRNLGVRGVFHYAPTGEVLDPQTMQWRLLPAGADPDEHPGLQLDFGEASAEQQWPNPTVRLPDDIEPGDYDLYLTATFEDVAPLEAATRIEVREHSGPAATFDDLRWRRQQPRDSDSGIRRPVERVDVQDIDVDGDDVVFDERDYEQMFQAHDEAQARDVGLAIAPSTGELKRGLPQTLYVRTFDVDTGHPVAATLTLERTRGMLSGELEETIRTDEFGIGTLELQPTTGLELLVEVDPDDGRSADFDDADAHWSPAAFEIELDAVATQYGLRPASYIVTGDDDIAATVDTTMPDGTFMTDLYDHDGNRLIDALSLRISDGQSGVRFEAPDPDETSPLVRLQTYRSLYGTRNAWDSSVLLLTDDDSPQALRQSATELYEWIADETGSLHHRHLVDSGALDDVSGAELQRIIEAGLHEVHPRYQAPPVLMNTRDADRQALDEWRDDIQHDLRWMMGITVAAGIIVVLYFVVVGIQRHRRDNELLQQLALDDDPPEAHQRRSQQLENYAVILQGLIVLLTLIAFALGILIMVSYL